MPENVSLPGYHWFHFLRDIPARIGIYTGVCLSVCFTIWLELANRVPQLEGFALARNLAAIVAFCFFASVPVFRFIRAPAELLLSGLLAWTLFSITYRVNCLFFALLEEKYSAFHVFVLGAVVYLLVATASWVGTIIWRARAAQSTHPHH
jgi:hypothetical protein